MIRHTVLFAWADGVSEEQKTRAKDGCAACFYGSEVLALDYGEDLGVPGPSRYGLALLHDHRDRAAWDTYNENATHHRVGQYIKATTVPDLAARVDWIYAGPVSSRGKVRHTALYRWQEGVTEQQKVAARLAIAGLRVACPSVRALEFGDDLGWYPPNFDWIVEAHFDGLEGYQAYLAHPSQLEAASLVDSLTRPDATARVTYRMLAG